jgi:hypothetical protein
MLCPTFNRQFVPQAGSGSGANRRNLIAPSAELRKGIAQTPVTVLPPRFRLHVPKVASHLVSFLA